MRRVPLRRQLVSLAASSAAAITVLVTGCGGEESGGATTSTGGPSLGGNAAPPAPDAGLSTTTGTGATSTGTTGVSTGDTNGGASGGVTGTATGAQSTGSGSNGDVAKVAGPSCDVASILATKCQTCHGEELVGGAPMPLVSHDDFQGMGPITQDESILSLVGARIRDPQRPMPPDNGLSEEEKVAIEQWIANGAPSDDGQGCGDVMGGTGGETTGTDKVWPPPDATECYEVRAHGDGGEGSPMIVRAGTETHPQVIHDAPWGNEPVEAVGFRAITDNSKVLHHWILYENTGGFGGAFLIGWAPGKDERDLPEDVALYLPSGPESLRLDMHYYNVGGAEDEPDNSGVEVCVAPAGTRKNTATTFSGFANIAGLRLPPQQETDITAYCSIESDEPVSILSVSPHMHEYGRHAKLEVKRADTGEIEVWHDGPFAFEDQQITEFPEVKTLYAGDEVKTTCSFENTSSQTVTFGENTGDEMCFNFVLYYPMNSFRCGGSSGFGGGPFGGGGGDDSPDW